MKTLFILVLSSMIVGMCYSEGGDLEGSESSQSYGYGYGTKVADQVSINGFRKARCHFRFLFA
jgi:hypothetical protein